MSLKTPFLLIASATLGLATATPASAIDSNTLTLNFSDLTVTSMTWNGTLEVSQGEEFSVPITFVESGPADEQTWNITLLADHSDTTPIATDFINDSGGYPSQDGNVDHQWSPTAALEPGYPAQLNFFFGVNICTSNAAVGCFTVYVGQGNTGLPFERNNWWVGSADLLSAFDMSYANIVFSGNTTVQFAPYNGNNINSYLVYVLPSVRAIPEPSTWALMGVGALGLAALRLRRRTGAFARADA
jgi:hypothetical protein